MEATPPAPSSPEAVDVQRWPSEIPLLVFVILASAVIWLALAVSIFGIVYAVLLGLFFFFAHVAFVTHVRGSAVRLGPRQFPRLHQRVVELSRAVALDPVPAAYLLESGGALNALASRFLRSRFIVLYSDLLDACDGDPAARDMVIGHELGHVKAGHLDWMWFLVPGMFVPFLGSAYSRARELTCDRYGAALCGDRAAAVRGLAILAAGASRGPRVDPESFVAQARDLDTGWMTLGKWLARHPPLCERVAAIQPALEPEGFVGTRGPTRAVFILASILLLPALVGGALVAVLGALQQAAERRTPTAATASDGATAPAAALPEAAPAGAPYGAMGEAQVAEAMRQFEIDFEDFQVMLREYDARGLPGPESLYDAWYQIYPEAVAPEDPFDGLPYGYDVSRDGRRLWSAGPDGEGGTEDDIERYFR